MLANYRYNAYFPLFSKISFVFLCKSSSEFDVIISHSQFEQGHSYADLYISREYISLMYKQKHTNVDESS